VAELWTRPSYTAGLSHAQPAAVALIALSPTPLPWPLPISRVRHGMPEEGEGPSAIDIVPRHREEHAGWFMEAVIGPFAEMIAADLGAEAAATALGAAHAYVINGELADPDDLGHVQAAWALAKCACEEGAAVVIDVFAARAHLGEEVAALPPDRAFDVMHEVTLFLDDQPDGTLAAWTLGLKKFGRPDLVILDVAADTATEAAVMLRDVAATLAAGDRIETGDHVDAGGRTFVAEPFDPESSSIVAVEGDAMLLR
jgi:hypothetical protein